MFGCQIFVMNLTLGGENGYESGISMARRYEPPAYGVSGGPGISPSNRAKVAGSVSVSLISAFAISGSFSTSATSRFTRPCAIFRPAILIGRLSSVWDFCMRVVNRWGSSGGLAVACALTVSLLSPRSDCSRSHSPVLHTRALLFAGTQTDSRANAVWGVFILDTLSVVAQLPFGTKVLFGNFLLGAPSPSHLAESGGSLDQHFETARLKILVNPCDCDCQSRLVGNSGTFRSQCGRASIQFTSDRFYLLGCMIRP
eukprot:m.433296 g.433296  ORF g.433296 m.433296 type:complete len:256 (+) comp17557_c0_seq1:464-1231(+)